MPFFTVDRTSPKNLSLIFLTRHTVRIVKYPAAAATPHSYTHSYTYCYTYCYSHC